jgi:hypothetical protein
MRGRGAYVVAVLLVLASVPIYWKVYERYSGAPARTASVQASGVARSVPRTIDCTSSRSADCIAFTNAMEATFALRDGRAKCVSGKIYRTYGHVIEPWPPGNLGCDDPYQGQRRRGVGVQPLR